MSRQKANDPNIKTVMCPGCSNFLTPEQVRIHVESCIKYVPTYVNNVCRFMDLMTPNYMHFLDAEMDIIKKRLMEKINQDINQRKNNAFGKSPQKGAIKNQESNYERKKIVIDNELKRQQYRNGPFQKNEKNLVPVKQIHEFKPMAIDQTLNLEQKLSNHSQKNQNAPSKKQTINCIYPQCKNPAQAQDFSKFRYLDECLHCICLKCFQQYITKNYVKANGDLRCPSIQCGCRIPIFQIKEIAEAEVLHKLQKQLNRKAMNLIQCQKCHQQYEFMKGKPADAPKKTPLGKPMTAAMAKHYAQHRFHCPKCRQQQCKTCKAAPYHLGFSCQEYQENKLKKKCRYCQSILPKGYMSQTGINTFDDICDSQECTIKTKQACSKKLKCGHSCFGYIREKNCLPCLNQVCALANSEDLRGQNQKSYCSLCYVEGLGESPCIRSKCGHIFHLQCLKKRLDLRWGTPRITFRFCQCPLCNGWLELPQESPLNKLLTGLKKFQNKILEKALKRLIHQKQDKNEKLTDKNSPYFGKSQKYAMAIYAYFQCFKCRQPYFGGRKSCAQVMADSKEGESFDPKQLICPSCCPVQVTDCKKHGKQYISFKCKFCCSVAQWFCWGNTHFCDGCHKRQVAGQYISRIPKDKLPQCLGAGKCPSGGGHSDNGEEYCLGCGVCRSERGDSKDF